MALWGLTRGGSWRGIRLVCKTGLDIRAWLSGLDSLLVF